jgi:hypothetical protein
MEEYSFHFMTLSYLQFRFEAGCGSKECAAHPVSLSPAKWLLDVPVPDPLFRTLLVIAPTNSSSRIPKSRYPPLQFLFEAGYGSKECAAHPGTIGVTQPRRVAALATARRVAEELGVKLGEEVGFQVRYDRRVGGEGAIKFMTDGILLREVQVRGWQTSDGVLAETELIWDGV